jgi:hypothetical protein
MIELLILAVLTHTGAALLGGFIQKIFFNSKKQKP